MKQSIYIIICLFVLSCKAQNPIVGLDAPYNTPNGAYYKDLNNELDKFSGTWTFTNGNTSLTIKLQKIIQLQIANDYRDYLVGEYQYIENGVELINTIPSLETNSNDTDNRKIGGSYIIDIDERPVCEDCFEGERRVSLYISDSERQYLDFSLTLRYLVGQTNPEQMTATIFSDNSGGTIPYEGAPVSLRVPAGEYLMQKQ